jgi:delta 1-pyrroline-5-carboxylate dehydrogenase
MRAEVLGPVLPVLRYSDFEDAIRRANDTPYGLGSSIWTHDVREIHRAAQAIDAGMTWVSKIHHGYDELPFGGIKDSGFGKEHGPGSARFLCRAPGTGAAADRPRRVRPRSCPREHADDPHQPGRVGRMAAASQVLLAHINGHSLGGGLELTLACDLRYADQGD